MGDPIREALERIVSVFNLSALYRHSPEAVQAWISDDLKPAIDAASAALAQPAEPVSEVERWKSLYRRAINEANGLTNYVEDRPELRSAERRIAAIEAEARTGGS